MTGTARSIRIEHSLLRRGRRTVLEQASFELPVPCKVGLIGANGAGKSTLLLALADLLTASAGSMVVTLAGDAPAVRIMLQSSALPRWASARAAAALYGADLDVLADRYPALRLGGIADRYVGALSGGDVQTLSFALVMNADAAITLLDEPFTHMDIGRRRAALNILADRRHGLTLMSAQTAADLAACEWFLVVCNGAYVFRGPRDALLDGSCDTRDTGQLLETRLIRLLGYDAAVAQEDERGSFS